MEEPTLADLKAGDQVIVVFNHWGAIYSRGIVERVTASHILVNGIRYHRAGRREGRSLGRDSMSIRPLTKKSLAEEAEYLVEQEKKCLIAKLLEIGRQHLERLPAETLREAIEILKL